ncbi:MAG: Gfo/Idh/MocA family oxidoreductase [Armatimonadota bacterium]|nr:Gfo/Idh/MocA family oxidoreductase [Armatimonadota bacterium]
MFRIGVIGVGPHARANHLPHLAAHPLVTLHALCDTDPARLEKAGSEFGVTRRFTDHRELLASGGLHAVYVLVSPAATAAVAADCLRAGVPTFIEKPPGSSLEEAENLAERAAETRTPHMVAFNRRFIPLVRRAKAILDEAGGVRHVCCEFLRYRRREEGFHWSTGIHGCDLLRFFGGDVADVHVAASHWKGDANEARFVTARFASGGIGRLHLLPEVGGNFERYTLHGRDITLFVHTPLPWTLDRPAACLARAGKLEELTLGREEWGTGFREETDYFVACLQSGEQPGPDLAEAAKSMRFAMQAAGLVS